MAGGKILQSLSELSARNVGQPGDLLAPSPNEAGHPEEIIVVTGATGFLGSHLTRRLAGQGVRVRALGRNLNRGLTLQGANIEFQPIDLSDRASLNRVCEGASAVVHSAALSQPWGRREDFETINISGTQNVVDACQHNDVKRLVYISSPSVLSRHEHQHHLTEEAAAPSTFVSVYSETKMRGEEIVMGARSRIETVVLRPKAICGPGDTTLFPRLIEAAATRRLRVIGEGRTTTHLTHVRDVVHAVLLALESDVAVGRTYNVTGGDEVELWSLMRDLVKRLGLPPIRGQVSVKKAMTVATAMEGLWRILRLRGEPPLTRYTVGILGYDQTFDISAAMSDLGYRPATTLTQGIEEIIADFQGRESEVGRLELDPPTRDLPSSVAQTSPELALTVLRTGTISTFSRLFGVGGKGRVVKVPVHFAVLEHSREGTVLFDTGQAPRFYQATRRWPFKLYGLAIPVNVTHEETAVSQLLQRGIHPESVRWIILSHFDPDHYGGLRDFPNAKVICSAEAWREARGRCGISALRARILPGHLPDDLCARLRLLPRLNGEALGPFSRSLDLFGDGSVRLVELPGHAPGQLGAWVTESGKGEFLLVADAAWTIGDIDRRWGGVHRLIARDRSERDATLSLLRQVKRDFPDVAIIPSHCPTVATSLGPRSVGGRPQ